MNAKLSYFMCAFLASFLLGISLFAEAKTNLTQTSAVSASSSSTHCLSTNGLNDQRCTPGIADRDKTAAVICAKGYTTKSVRPPASYTTRLKLLQIEQYGYLDKDPAHYEEDHLISLELGGDPKDPENLFPEPEHVPVNGQDLGYHTKDQVENYLHKAVCTNKMNLLDAQRGISTDWTQYVKFLTNGRARPSLRKTSSSASSGK